MGRRTRFALALLAAATILAGSPAWARRVAIVVIAAPELEPILREAAGRAVVAPDSISPAAPALAPDAEVTEQRLALLASKAEALVILRANVASDGVALAVRALIADRASDRRELTPRDQLSVRATELMRACLLEAASPAAIEARPRSTGAPPPVVGAPPPSQPPPPPQPKRRHPYGLLLAGTIGFLLPYLATVGVGAYYMDYNPNASRAGYIPLAGPFLARNRMSDKDLSDGFGPGLIADGVLQAATFGMLVSGILWCAIGERTRSTAHAARPVLSFGTQQAMGGLQVSF